MKKLNEKEWEAFGVKSLFDTFIRGKISSATDETEDANGLPYVGATDKNNGVMRFIESTESKKQKGNCVVFIRDGQGSVGSSIYRKTDFIATVNTTSAYNKRLNESNGIFISTASNMNRNKYSFGYKRKDVRLKAEKIMLPSTFEAQPDYEYMENYIQFHRQRMLSQYKQYALDWVSELEYKKISEVSEKEWANFHIPEIFDENIQRGKRLTKANQNPGMVPYVSSTANNNGVDNYIEITKDARAFYDCISLANSGSVGKAFYEPFEYVASDHVTSLKRKESSKYLYLFLTTVIEYQRSNFNFNREINDSRIQKMQLMLPVDEAGEPDYEYMEQYAKNMMLKKYKQYLDYLKNKA